MKCKYFQNESGIHHSHISFYSDDITSFIIPSTVNEPTWLTLYTLWLYSTRDRFLYDLDAMRPIVCDFITGYDNHKRYYFVLNGICTFL